MPESTATPTRLDDYCSPAFSVDSIELDIALDPGATRVTSRLALRRATRSAAPLRLDGVGLKTLTLAIDDRVLDPGDFVSDARGLTIPGAPDVFVLTSVVEIDPEANKALSGLYISGGRYCTQCEAEGFRRITWCLDRPDVLARYKVRVEAPSVVEHLLSNGNLIDSGPAGPGRHFAVWEDPFPKPSYLFALVAGRLDFLEDNFVTRSGRVVTLKIFVDSGIAPRAAYALDCLKRAMAWDERTFGREYDLDLFMIVAVRDFNFGAMENKGLNIFNASLLLADPATATDQDYEHIESVVAHEYFHNWTGNRITCRDWFQLCLKEGLTVYRDQRFSADQRDAGVRRIKDVMALRARQFAEDAGPTAHPVRPKSYVKIDNFYTATIYEKGAEVIRMLETLVGADAFRRGLDLYFDRWDGQAATVEAFVACFEEVCGRDLADYFGWYEQAGTPRVSLKSEYDAANQALDLHFSQHTDPTPGQPDKRALPIPIRLGLLDQDGRAQRESEVFVLEGAAQSIRLFGVEKTPVLSALRGFSAPVILATDAPDPHAYTLMASDTDPFNRWEAGQALARNLILRRAAGDPDEIGEARFAEAMSRGLIDQSSSPAFKALLLGLPSENDLALFQTRADPGAIHDAREDLRARLAVHLGDTLRRLHGEMQDGGPYRIDAEAAGRRALHNAALELLAADSHAVNRARARGHFSAAANMTDMIGGLTALMLLGGEDFQAALNSFYARWRQEALVIDKWFAVQARDPAPGTLDRVIALTAHPDFETPAPDRLRALVLGFAVRNPARFHDPSGAGYRFLADQVLLADGSNPTLAARLFEPLSAWKRYIPILGAMMRREVERIARRPGLSENVKELADMSLA